MKHWTLREELRKEWMDVLGLCGRQGIATGRAEGGFLPRRVTAF